MSKKSTKQSTNKVRGIRIEDELWEDLAEHAEKNSRTVAGEIVHRLKSTLEDTHA